MFTIDVDKNISYGDIAGSQFDSPAGLLAEVELRNWSKSDVTDIWNSFAGVAPFGELKPQKMFKNKPYGIAQIWKAIQRLRPEGLEAESHEAGAVREEAEVMPKAARKKKVKRVVDVPVSSDGATSGEKASELVRLISRERGASLDELAEKLGWQRHTVRGRISTLGSKGGLKIISEKSDSRGRIYRVG